MISIKEKSLSLALEYAACRDLPKKFDENGVDFWLEAIAYVRKRDSSCSYCIVRHLPNGYILYTKDFGTTSPIFSLISVHPYKVLDIDRFGYKGSDSAFLNLLLSRGEISCKDSTSLTPGIIKEYRVRYAIDAQEQADLAFKVGLRVDEGYDCREEKTEEQPAGDGVIEAEDGSIETFTDIVKCKSGKTTQKGRKPKNNK